MSETIWTLQVLLKCIFIVVCNDMLVIFNMPVVFRKGDYHRYLAEFATGDERKKAAELSLLAYQEASNAAGNDLPPTHPIRLGRSCLQSLQSTWNSPDSLDMSSEFWKCLARVNLGQCPANRCPPKSLIFARHFTMECPARIQHVWWRNGGLPDVLSGKAQKNFTYTAVCGVQCRV